MHVTLPNYILSSREKHKPKSADIKKLQFISSFIPIFTNLKEFIYYDKIPQLVIFLQMWILIKNLNLV